MNRLLQVAMLLTITGFFMSCRKTPTSSEFEKMMEQEENMSVEEAQNVVIRYTDSAVLKAKITAPVLLRYPKRKEAYTEMPKGLYAIFYDQYGKEDSHLSAAYGINYEAKKLIKLTDSVRVVNNKGEELKSEELFWDQQEKRIYTNTFVRIIRNGETLRGDGFESNESFTKYRILKPAGPVTVQDNLLKEDEESQ